MKDEIKEILEDVKRHLDYVEATKQASIRDNEMKAMYDYITNLQEENERLNNIIDEIEKELENHIALCTDITLNDVLDMVHKLKGSDK